MRRIFSLLLVNLYLCDFNSCNGDLYKTPTVGISVLVRNKAHTLPFFLTGLYDLDYPKKRMYLWMYSDFNQDSSEQILRKWVDKYGSEYAGIYITTNSTSGPLHSDEKSSVHWSTEHFKHVILLRQLALEFARNAWADFLFMLDADVFLTNPATLKILVGKGLDVVAPMLLSDGLYSNFWCLTFRPGYTGRGHKLTLESQAPIRCGMTESYYYKRTDEYKPIQTRKQIGCFDVPMVHTAVLIHMRTLASERLTYDPSEIRDYFGPTDDIIAFAVNAKKNGIVLTICNDVIYGFVPVPLEDYEDVPADIEQLINVKLEAISRGNPIKLDEYMKEYVQYPKLSKFDCSEIFMINLERRKERRQLMELSFKELGMDVKHFKAVDGQTLDMRNLIKLGVTLMPNYEDPYHKRPMKAGEVGCFLSHYNIWKEIVAKQLVVTLILEDDIHFTPYFRNRFLELVREIKDLDWDLVYIGRKILLNDEEEYVTQHTTKPRYSYWTLGYLLTQRGAQKLIDAKPLENMVPVDEFLPIMFDQHPNETLKAKFPVRNLNAFSAAPLLVHPTHYTGEDGYISDTEDSEVITHQQ